LTLAQSKFIHPCNQAYQVDGGHSVNSPNFYHGQKQGSKVNLTPSVPTHIPTTIDVADPFIMSFLQFLMLSLHESLYEHARWEPIHINEQLPLAYCYNVDQIETLYSFFTFHIRNINLIWAFRTYTQRVLLNMYKPLCFITAPLPKLGFRHTESFPALIKRLVRQNFSKDRVTLADPRHAKYSFRMGKVLFKEVLRFACRDLLGFPNAIVWRRIQDRLYGEYLEYTLDRMKSVTF